MATESFVLRVPEWRRRPMERDELLQLLDRTTRPLSVREIDRALSAAGVSQRQACKLASALKHHRIVLVAIADEEGSEHEHQSN